MSRFVETGEGLVITKKDGTTYQIPFSEDKEEGEVKDQTDIEEAGNRE